jgi:cystathionine beta-lyase
MTYNFDEQIERRGTGSAKWEWYDEDVLPLWVADMDFRAPEPVIQALHRRIEHGIFGYEFNPKELKTVICERLARLYGWQVQPDEILFLPGIVSALNVACRAFGEPGDGVLMQTPVYPPFLTAPGNFNKTADLAELAVGSSGRLLHYELDDDRFEAAITPRTRLFLLCNPHNPVGRVYSRRELERLAESCARHDLVICSDEIHCDLLFDGRQHIPIAALAPEVSARTVTLMAPSKTFNIPGLACGFAVIQNPDLMKQMQKAAAGITGHISSAGYTAALAAYQEGQPWLDAALAYLDANRRYVTDYVLENFPGVSLAQPEGTYLSWLDWREAGLPERPYDFFLKNARVALNDGALFGKPGEGFLRLNFAAPRALLAEALERMRSAWAGLAAETGR